ncbi:hypothetical protein KIN20_001301 [Parelaphostrongylus tenuis]|uniref:Uncharacterized protein n=1 Tax=Parelaphostrongylus tenuis TaxID=148309 RepID=A0AAD5LW01_PARTN|nr:hypothetical protein KIN20_001301 [Parelaphostrongylus tenuis]
MKISCPVKGIDFQPPLPSGKLRVIYVDYCVARAKSIQRCRIRQRRTTPEHTSFSRCFTLLDHLIVADEKANIGKDQLLCTLDSHHYGFMKISKA